MKKFIISSMLLFLFTHLPALTVSGPGRINNYITHGDNLGNHIASMTISLQGNDIINVGASSYTVSTQFDALSISTNTLRTDTNAIKVDTGTLRTDLEILAFSTGTISGDNLGNHIATTTLNMAANYILDVSSINFDGGTQFTGQSGKILVEGGDLEIDEVLIVPEIEGWNGNLSISGRVSFSSISLLDSGQIEMNKASILNISSITFQDGTYISSSPFLYLPAGGSSEGVTVATFSYTFLCSDPAMSNQNTSRFPAIMGTGFSCYEIVESTWYITGVRATAIIKSTISACSFELTYSSMTDWTTFEEFGTTKLSPTFDIISEQIHIDTDSWRSDWVVPSKTTIKPNEALSFLISQVPPSNDAAKNILIEIRYWRKLDE